VWFGGFGLRWMRGYSIIMIMLLSYSPCPRSSPLQRFQLKIILDSFPGFSSSSTERPKLVADGDRIIGGREEVGVDQKVPRTSDKAGTFRSGGCTW